MFIGNPCSNPINFLDEEGDSLAWYMNAVLGEYSLKYGYKAYVENEYDGPTIWWWEKEWKLHCPLKTKMVLWISFRNKILTWDNGVK